MYEATIQKDPKDRAKILEKNEELAKVHEISASEGQTAAPNAQDDIDTHFVCFVEIDGDLYELDGRNKSAISFGSSGGNLAVAASKVIKEIMALAPNQEHRFSVLAFAGNPE